MQTARDAVDRVLEVTGLRAELPVHTRREEAFNEVSGSGRAGRMSDGGLELTLPATAENVIVVRQAIAGPREALGLSALRGSRT